MSVKPAIGANHNRHQPEDQHHRNHDNEGDTAAKIDALEARIAEIRNHQETDGCGEQTGQHTPDADYAVDGDRTNRVVDTELVEPDDREHNQQAAYRAKVRSLLEAFPLYPTLDLDYLRRAFAA